MNLDDAVKSKPDPPRHDLAFRDRDRPTLGLLVKSLLIAWILASMLFAHGCHGNEDHELFAAWAELNAAKK